MPVRLLTVGGFLGQLDGFCEHPGGTYDKAVVAPFCAPGGPGGQGSPAGAQAADKWPAALGGLIGAAAWVERQRSSGTAPLVLVTGDNQVADYPLGIWSDASQKASMLDAARTAREGSQHAAQERTKHFWSELERLQPTVVGLGPADFVRSLRIPPGQDARFDPPGYRAAAFVSWVRSNRLRLLASNAIVKLEGNRLNVVEDGACELAIDRDASIDWVQTLNLEHPAVAVTNVVLEESPAPFDSAGANLRTVATNHKTADDQKQTTITVREGSLLPGMHYRLRVTAEGIVREFHFRTHNTLMPNTLTTTPWVGPGTQTPSSAAVLLKGFPVVLSPLGTGEDLLIISLVTSNTRLGIGKSAWTSEDPLEPAKPGKKRPESSVDFISPTSAIEAILRRLAAGGAPAPYIVLLSQLEDEETLDVMEHYPEIRVVALHPDSTLLGRASRKTDPNEEHLVAHTFGQRRTLPNDPTLYSGDLGFAGVVNRDRPAATQLLARPEWIGETGARLEVALLRNPNGEWEAHDPNVQVDTIPGVALTYERLAEGLFYWPVGHQSMRFGPYQPYLSTAVAGASGNAKNFIEIWRDAGAFAAAAGESVRTALKSDVAVVPDDLFDTDALGWLKHALQIGDTGWLSRFILERAVFRSYRFVRSDVAGTDLLDKLGKALSDPLETGSKACIIGFGAQKCPATLNKEHPERVRVRDRAIVSSVFYNVVLPDAMAEKLELEHDDEIGDSRDALTTLHDYLAHSRWEETPLPQPPDVKNVFSVKASREIRSYLRIPTFELGVSQIFVSEPDERAGVLANLPVDFKAAQPERTLTGKLDADLALWEARGHAGRILGNIDVSKRTEFKDKEPDEVTFPRDSVFVGARIEGRLLPRQGAVEWRPYFGGFLEGPTRPTEFSLTASRPSDVQRDGFKTQEKAGFSTPLSFDPSRYLYAAAGIDALPAAKDIIPAASLSATITKMTADIGYGRQSNVLVGLDLGDQSQDLSRFLGEGAQALLNEYFKNHAGTFDETVRWHPVTEPRNQWRARLTLEGELGWKRKTETYKATLAFQYSQFKMSEAEDLALSRNAKFTSKFTIPFFWRFELVPTYEVQWATINADDNNRFGAQRFELRANLPFFVRFGGGRFVQ